MTSQAKDFLVIMAVISILIGACQGSLLAGIFVAIGVFGWFFFLAWIKSRNDIRKTKWDLSHKIVWSKKQQKFIEIPKNQKEWE